MSINYLLNVSQETLEASLVVAQQDYMEMTAIVGAGGGDVNTQRQTMGSLEKRIEQLLSALNKLDPAKYPIDQVTRNERTGVAFS